MTITAVDGRPCFLTTDYTVYLEELGDLVDLAARMRQAQKEYLRTREYAFLQEAKNLEAELDEQIVRYTI
jgi:hypothetical protein